MSTAERLQTAFQSSMTIIEDVRRAQTQLAVFENGCIDGHGILREPDKCSDALTSAIRLLLDAQKRLVETSWPESRDVNRADAA